MSMVPTHIKVYLGYLNTSMFRWYMIDHRTIDVTSCTLNIEPICINTPMSSLKILLFSLAECWQL